MRALAAPLIVAGLAEWIVKLYFWAVRGLWTPVSIASILRDVFGVQANFARPAVQAAADWLSAASPGLVLVVAGVALSLWPLWRTMRAEAQDRAILRHAKADALAQARENQSRRRYMRADFRGV